MSTLTHAHIEIDDQGKPCFAGTRFRIVHVILEKVAWGLSAEEIQENHPDLTLAQIYSAFSYYYDHRSQLDAELGASTQEYEQRRLEDQDSPIRRKLLEMRERQQP